MTTMRSIQTLFLLAILSLLCGQPVSAQQQVGVDGDNGGAELIFTTTLENLASVIVNIPDTGSLWHCVATCSIEIVPNPNEPNALDNDGRCALTILFPFSEVSGSSRRFEVNGNPGVDDPFPIVVATTARIVNIEAGSRTINCACAKVAVEDAGYLVNRSSLTTVCSDFIL